MVFVTRYPVVFCDDKVKKEGRSAPLFFCFKPSLFSVLFFLLLFLFSPAVLIETQKIYRFHQKGDEATVHRGLAHHLPGIGKEQGRAFNGQHRRQMFRRDVFQQEGTGMLNLDDEEGLVVLGVGYLGGNVQGNFPMVIVQLLVLQAEVEVNLGL